MRNWSLAGIFLEIENGVGDGACCKTESRGVEKNMAEAVAGRCQVDGKSVAQHDGCDSCDTQLRIILNWVSIIIVGLDVAVEDVKFVEYHVCLAKGSFRFE